MQNKDNGIKNPWIGLESYKEGDIIYGRDEDIRNLTQRVLNDTEVLLYGKSGIGKSSILNAGVIPAARRRGYLPVMIRLSHKANDSYLGQISTAIENAILAIPIKEKENKQENIRLNECIREEVQCRDKENESLYEYFHRHTYYSANGERLKLWLLFDQFEEIFTLQSSERIKKKFFSELADLFNDIMPVNLQHIDHEQVTSQKVEFESITINLKKDTPQYVKDNDIHFLFTIREDFLSEFEYYTAAIPSLKNNRYGLRPINEEQAAKIIMDPIPGLISKKVAKLIIEKVAGRTDFELDGVPDIEVDSAVLSLYLKNLYDSNKGEEITSDLVKQKGSEIITESNLDANSDLSNSNYVEGLTEDESDMFADVEQLVITEDESDGMCYDFVEDGATEDESDMFSDVEILGIDKDELDGMCVGGCENIEDESDIIYNQQEGITEDMVKQKGGEIVTELYLEAISILPDSTVKFLEDHLLNGEGRRDSITVNDAIHKGGITEAELDILCNEKKILRKFNYAGDMRIEYVHDILCPVVKAHRDELILFNEQQRILQEEQERHKKLLQEEQDRRRELELKLQSLQKQIADNQEKGIKEDSHI